MIKELMQLLRIDAETAERVRDLMDHDGIDYSECSQRVFERCAREALARLLVQS